MTDRGSREASGEERPLLVKILNQAEKVVYYGAALALLVTVGYCSSQWGRACGRSSRWGL